MDRDQVAAKYGEMLSSSACAEAYIKDGSLYYRYETADPVTEPGQITYNRIDDGQTEPVKVSVKEFHEAQKGDKLK
jgi:hypothetical protein